LDLKFIHTADIHLGKTYRNTPNDVIRYEDFFLVLDSIVADAIKEKVDFMLISGDLFHTGQILPKTFARTVESIEPLKEAGIPCIAIEGNHDWIHRRFSISWMETLSHMGYIQLLRPKRTESGGYSFEPFDLETGNGGHIKIGDLNIYGLGYIGAQAGYHVERICESISTKNNLLLFHVGIWTFSPVEIGNMTLDAAQPLAEKFKYVALGHGHKQYIIETADGKPFAFNPGAPERVNFGEEKYDKGYFLVKYKNGKYSHEFRPTDPRPMLVEVISLDGSEDAEIALKRFSDQIQEKLINQKDKRNSLLELKLVGRVGFHPFELGREVLRAFLNELISPLHVEIKNHLSLVASTGGEEVIKKSLAEIERDVLGELISVNSNFKGREKEMIELSLAIRDLVLKGSFEDDEILELLSKRV